MRPLLAVALTHCMLAAAHAGSLHGQTLGEFGDPLPFSSIRVQCADADTVLAAISDEDGRWALDAPAGPANLRIQALGFLPWETEIEVSSAGRHVIDARLRPDPGFRGSGVVRVPTTYQGRVVDAQDGQPLTEVVVLAWETHDGAGRLKPPVHLPEVRTDESGTYTLSLGSGSSVLFWKEGYDFELRTSAWLRRDTQGCCEDCRFPDVALTRTAPSD